MVTLTLAMMKALARNPDDQRVGNFRYTHDHTKPTPRWYSFYDGYGNEVKHGGHSDLDEVIITIAGFSSKIALIRLLSYLKDLVRRHDEHLHTQGAKRFRQVSITLPPLTHGNEDFEASIYTGASTEYNQKEIAYEVMAAISGVAVLKTIAPHKSYGKFIRKDRPQNNGQIRYFFAGAAISVKFSHQNDTRPVILSMYRGDGDFDNEESLFNECIFAFLEEYVAIRTGKKLTKKHGSTIYQGSNGNPSVVVEIDFKKSFVYKVSVPYRGSVSYPRLSFSLDIMGRISRAFARAPC